MKEEVADLQVLASMAFRRKLHCFAHSKSLEGQAAAMASRTLDILSLKVLGEGVSSWWSIFFQSGFVDPLP